MATVKIFIGERIAADAERAQKNTILNMNQKTHGIGDRIDADAILKDRVSNAYISRFEIDAAPTIIPAEGGDAK